MEKESKKKFNDGLHSHPVVGVMLHIGISKQPDTSVCRGPNMHLRDIQLTQHDARQCFPDW